MWGFGDEKRMGRIDGPGVGRSREFWQGEARGSFSVRVTPKAKWEGYESLRTADGTCEGIGDSRARLDNYASSALDDGKKLGDLFGLVA